MKKIIIIGCPGAGKSTFAKRLNKFYNIKLYHLDLIWNTPDKKTITREEFDTKLEEIFKEQEWIMDGNYQRTLEKRIIECNTVFLLDYPLNVCLEGANSRIGVKREDMPWVEDTLNEKFKQEIIGFSETCLPTIYDLLEKYKKNRNIIIFKSREESQKYLESLERK